MSETVTGFAAQKCPYCNGYHDAVCAMVKSLEYHPDGRIKRVEFHSPAPFDISNWRIGTAILARAAEVEGAKG